MRLRLLSNKKSHGNFKNEVYALFIIAIIIGIIGWGSPALPRVIKGTSFCQANGGVNNCSKLISFNPAFITLPQVTITLNQSNTNLDTVTPFFNAYFQAGINATYSHIPTGITEWINNASYERIAVQNINDLPHCHFWANIISQNLTGNSYIFLQETNDTYLATNTWFNVVDVATNGIPATIALNSTALPNIGLIRNDQNSIDPGRFIELANQAPNPTLGSSMASESFVYFRPMINNAGSPGRVSIGNWFLGCQSDTFGIAITVDMHTNFMTVRVSLPYTVVIQVRKVFFNYQVIGW